MNNTFRLCTIALLLVGCSNNAQDDPPQSTSTNVARVEQYHRGDGREVIACTRSPERDICVSDHQLGNQYADCSNEQFDCVFDHYNVFAVPRQGVSPGQEFNVHGAALKVERCFGEAGSCQVAMISSMCSTEADCACRLADDGKTQAIFYYSSDLGITAFYTFVPGLQQDASQSLEDEKVLSAAKPLRTYVLSARTGFLREHWNIRKAEYPTRCSR